MEVVVSKTMHLPCALFFVSLWLCGWSLKLSGSAKHAVLFTPNNLRVHDNVCLKFIEKDHQNQYVPLYINDCNLPLDASVVTCLKRNLFRMGGQLKCIDMNLADAADALAAAGVEHLVTSACHLDPFAAHYEDIYRRMKRLVVKVTTLEDNLGVKLGKTRSFDPARCNQKHKRLPQMTYDIIFNNNLSDSIPLWSCDDCEEQNEMVGEDLALKLVSDYMTLGDRAFTLKYQDQYARTIARSEDHMLSVRRLAGSVCTESAYFPGEVLSGLLAPLITMGCVSPHVLRCSSRTMFPGVLFPDHCRAEVLQQEGIRHDWHKHLASLASRKRPGRPSAQNIVLPHWKFCFSPWRGYIQRYAVMHAEASGETKH